MDDKDPELGGGRPEGLGVVFKGGSSGGVDFWGRNVGPEPLDGAGPEKIPAQCRATAHWEAAKAEG